MTNELQKMAAAALDGEPDTPWIEFEDKWITRGEIRAAVQAISDLLDAAGVLPDNPVALLARNRPWSLSALLALLAQGRNVQMVYGFQSPAGIARDLDRLSPAALIADAADFSEPVREVLAAKGMAAVALDRMNVLPVEPFTLASEAARRQGPEERQIAIFTSGTTGPPKQFALPYGLISEHIIKKSRAYNLPDPDSVPPQLLYFPVGNISGIYATLPSLLARHKAIVLDRFSLEAWHAYVLRYRPAMGGIPPSYYQILLDSDIPVEDLASIKVMGAGAAPVDPRVQSDFEEKYGIPILNSYGATEFGGPVTAMTPEDHARYGKAKVGTVGRPIPGAELRVVDAESGAELAAGEEGLFEVISPRFEHRNWIRTSDIGVIDEDGFVYHRGRADGAIMRGGFKILPETIEAALKSHPLVSEAVVAGLPDRRLGQVPVVAVRLQPGAASVEVAELEAYLRERVMNTHIPARWMFCEELPRTASAKLDRNAVSRLFAEELA